MIVGVATLPRYAICTVEELLRQQLRQDPCKNLAAKEDDDHWVDCPQQSKHGSFGGRYKFNKKGRLVLVTREEREIVVVAVARNPTCDVDPLQPVEQTSSSVDVLAFDKNCYHVGYPMDLGDIEDIPVRCTTDGSDFHVTCITCPLHNRIFDLRTGALVTIDYDSLMTRPSVSETNPSASTPQVPVCVVSAGKRKGGAPSTHGCHQRIHVVTIDEEDDGHHRIVVSDTFGCSNVTAERDGNQLVVQQEVQILSDKFNPVGAFEDFHEFNPKKGNSFVQFRPPEEPKLTSGQQADATTTINESASAASKPSAAKCCTVS